MEKEKERLNDCIDEKEIFTSNIKNYEVLQENAFKVVKNIKEHYPNYSLLGIEDIRKKKITYQDVVTEASGLINAVEKRKNIYDMEFLFIDLDTYKYKKYNRLFSYQYIIDELGIIITILKYHDNN